MCTHTKDRSRALGNSSAWQGAWLWLFLTRVYCMLPLEAEPTLSLTYIVLSN